MFIRKRNLDYHLRCNNHTIKSAIVFLNVITTTKRTVIYTDWFKSRNV